MKSSILQEDLLDDDDDEDRLILDRSPADTGSQDNDLDELESDDELEGTLASDGERVIYPWMKKIHVAGVGKSSTQYKKNTIERNSWRHFAIFFLLSLLLFRTSSSFSALFKSGLLFEHTKYEAKNIDFLRIMSEHAFVCCSPYRNSAGSF